MPMSVQRAPIAVVTLAAAACAQPGLLASEFCECTLRVGLSQHTAASRHWACSLRQRRASQPSSRRSSCLGMRPSPVRDASARALCACRGTPARTTARVTVSAMAAAVLHARRWFR